MKNRGWIDILSKNDDQALWTSLYGIISRHAAVRMLCGPHGASLDGLKDVYSDLTQDLFLRLFQKDRLRSYLDRGYTDKEVEQELYRIEVPNLVSHLQRERYPESYRIARRISDLLQTRPEFQLFQTPVRDSGESTRLPCRKMALKVFGLSTWPREKAMKPASSFTEMVKDVPVRQRDTRRTGRGSGSQIIIS